MPGDSSTPEQISKKEVLDSFIALLIFSIESPPERIMSSLFTTPEINFQSKVLPVPPRNSLLKVSNKR